LRFNRVDVMNFKLLLTVLNVFFTMTMEESSSSKRKFNTHFPKVLLFGDSLTQKGFHDGGWCSKLVEDFERKCDFLNRGFNGYTSRMAEVILPNLLKHDGQPKGSLYATTILLGTNDAVLRDKDDRHVPVEEYKKNLVSIISKMESKGIPSENIILISPPPMDLEAWSVFSRKQGYLPVSHSEESLVQYVNASLSIANELNIRSIDLWKGMLEQQKWRELFCDGLHFSKEGHEFLYERVKEHFDVILAPLKIVYPDWKSVNHIHPEKDLKIAD